MKQEEAGHPEGPGQAVLDPVIDEGTAVDEVVDPASQRLQGGVGHIGPQTGHLTVEEGCVDEL